jgi:hypothetical protein
VDLRDVADLDSFSPTLAPYIFSFDFLLITHGAKYLLHPTTLQLRQTRLPTNSVYYSTRTLTIYHDNPITISSVSPSITPMTLRHMSSRPPHPRLYRNTKLDINRVINRFRPTLAIWGITAGLGVSLYLSEVPLFQKDVLRKIPFVSCC